VGEYLQSGVKLVWVINPESRIATIYRSLDNVRTVTAGESLDGEDVVPGLRCSLTTLVG
jgi:Uma2 family endonuclease